MNGYYTKNFMHSYTKMCLKPRTRVFVSKPKKGSGGEQVPPSEDKIIRRQDKVDDLKSDAKRQKIISYNHIGL
jgi:hypothetical protein